MIAADGKEYYSVKEAAVLAGVPHRTLRRWISEGQLSDFLYPFRTRRGTILYRLEPPGENDKQDRDGNYLFPGGGEGT